MNELLPMITERDGIPVTTSRAVAEQFGKQLGRRERTETVLIAKTAYKVYAEYTAHPLARLTLWSVLEQIGTIEARERDSAPMVASFKECKAGAIYIKNEKLERR